jgi:class 3 adenylate cyclase
LNLLLDFLQSRRSLRWLGHGLGLLAGSGLLWLSGEMSDEILQKALALALLLLVVELVLSVLDAKKRRLIRLAPAVFPLKNLSEEDRLFVQQSLGRAPMTAFRRSVLAWVLACVGLGLWRIRVGVFGLDVLFLSLALPVSALTQAYGQDLLLKRVLPFFYFESDYAKNLGSWLPKLGDRLRRFLAVPVAVILAPVGAAFILAQPLSLGALLWIGAWGCIAVLASAWALESLVAEPIQDLQQALHRFGQGDLQALLDVTSGDELGHATETYNKTLRAVDRRFFVLERFGHSVAPAKSEQLFEGGLRLDGELRAIAVLECAWQNVDAATKSLEPVARLATLNRFYEVIQDAVDKAHGAVLQAGEGRVLACWGAPLMDEQAVQGALAAAWNLKAQLKVWASQQYLRGASAVQWGLGVASGQATVGLVGPKGKQRYSVLGGPVSEVRGLAQREAGPWLDERSAGSARAPFAVQILQPGAQLCAGPEPEGPSASDLGFKPGEKL